ncbi:GTP-binding protein [Halalkalibacterium halodurans]|uniref:GTP-binding protein n=1 Tax=Halalkalibacterium halodurans TaxID=86665 RepID=UPI002AA97F73|nr:GTP-binding protein [Halalkalibacterium halodurans]MDY7221517.1 GTP-binding protein [Halalkalibacterium halodurans]MDY7240793.1 GTP-binding protein [Halalkalibacterium halodurans]MED4125603.1 GTP-binding protein [Halalkalibacterium halodurans]
MNRQKPLTVISGFSENGKRELMKSYQENRQNHVKIIRFHPKAMKLTLNGEDPFPVTSFIGEAIHHVEATTEEDLMSLLAKEHQNRSTDEILLDVSPFSSIDSLLEQFTSDRRWFIASHVHVLDAKAFWFSYFSEHEIITADQDFTQTLGEALILQLELADTLCLYHQDGLSSERLGELTAFLRVLQPRALLCDLHEAIQRCQKGHTTFDKNGYASLYVEQRNLVASRQHVKVIHNYGVDTFFYQSSQPVGIHQLERFFEHLPNDIFRMKGRCYNPQTGELHSISQVGAHIQVDTTTTDLMENRDVQTELLFIGFELDRYALSRLLHECLQPNHDRIAFG